jgi:hypothetical protein
LHVLPGQQVSLVPPHATHVPPVQTEVPLEQTVPFDRHVTVAGSQHSLARLHMLPLQQIWFPPPQGEQVPPAVQTSAPAAHEAPVATHW